MSRMTFTLCLLTLISSGCQVIDYAKYNLCLATARIESLTPSRCRSNGSCRDGGDCIPHRPFTHGYISDYDNCITLNTAQRCAFNGLAAYRVQSGRPASHHFKMGFIAAYEDIAFNRQPVPPSVPPSKYWNAYYRSPAGQPCVEDWFAGYDAGREMGLNSGAAEFNEVYLNRYNRADAQAVPLNFDQAANCESEQAQPWFRSVSPAGHVNGRY